MLSRPHFCWIKLHHCQTGTKLPPAPRALRPARAARRPQFVVRRQDGSYAWQPGEDSTTLASLGAVRLVALDA